MKPLTMLLFCIITCLKIVEWVTARHETNRNKKIKQKFLLQKGNKLECNNRQFEADVFDNVFERNVAAVLLVDGLGHFGNDLCVRLCRELDVGVRLQQVRLELLEVCQHTWKN